MTSTNKKTRRGGLSWHETGGSARDLLAADNKVANIAPSKTLQIYKL